MTKEIVQPFFSFDPARRLLVALVATNTRVLLMVEWNMCPLMFVPLTD